MRQNKFRGTVFLKNLPSDYTEAQLAALFDPYGLVLGVLIARDPATGASKRFGLVDIAPTRAADEAVEALNGAEIDGQSINVRRADPEMAINVPSPRFAQRKHRESREDWGHHGGRVNRFQSPRNE